jgi:CBS domain containing-hemolysin-like protein
VIITWLVGLLLLVETTIIAFAYRKLHFLQEQEHQDRDISTNQLVDTLVSEVMTPRLDMPIITTEASVDEAAELFLSYGVNRLAIYEGNPDAMLGVVHMEDVLKAKVQGEPFCAKELVRTALVVPESKPVGELFETMRKDRVSVALVADEYGTAAGIITMDDLVEYIVGDLWDEHDPEEEDRIQAVDEQSSIIDGRLTVDEINDALSINLPTDAAHTVGGWIFHNLGRLPRVGDTLECHGVEFKVVSMDNWRIDRVRVHKSDIDAAGG